MGQPPEIPLLLHWETFLEWLLPKTAQLPRSVRYTFAERIQGLALDVLEGIVDARYGRSKGEALRRVNLGLEKLRMLVRICHRLGHLDHRAYELASRGLDFPRRGTEPISPDGQRGTRSTPTIPTSGNWPNSELTRAAWPDLGSSGVGVGMLAFSHPTMRFRSCTPTFLAPAHRRLPWSPNSSLRPPTPDRASGSRHQLPQEPTACPCPASSSR